MDITTILGILQKIFGIGPLYERNNVDSGIVIKGDNLQNFSVVNNVITNKQLPKEKLNITIDALKEDIIKNHENWSIVDLIHKASLLANLKKDKKTVDWLNKELFGYSSGVPDYREVSSKMDVGFRGFNGRMMLDLRNDPIPILLGIGMSTLWQFYTPENKSGIRLWAPAPEEFKKIISKMKSSIKEANFNLNRTPYTIDYEQLGNLISKLKQKIILYVSET